MKILTVIELKCLPNIDEKELTILLAILKNKDVIEFIKNYKENSLISAEEMNTKYGINCHILFINSEENDEKRAIVVPLENQINGGGKHYSSQYKSYALDNGQTYFIKTFKIDEESLPEYQNEVETLAGVGRLQGKVICKKTEIHYLVTSFVKGIDLEKYKYQIPAKPEIKDFLKTFGLFNSASCQVKAFIDLGLIHRDIKPANIMIDADNQCHLVDFGSSSSDKNPKPTSWGTGPYLAPELDNENDFLDYTTESDLYALGHTFEEIFYSFNQLVFVRTLTKDHKYLLPLHKEIKLCIDGLKSNRGEVRVSFLLRMTQLQRVPESFKSKPEAYTYMIMLLNQWLNCYKETNELKEVISAIRIAYENHVQDVSRVKILLERLKENGKLLSPHQALLVILIHSFDNIATPKIGDDDILPRRFESDFACQVIQKPTKKMMEAIKQVSDAIVNILNEYQSHKPSSAENQIIQEFLEKTVDSDILFGATKTKLSIEEIIAILSENDVNNFVKIQHISFKFAQVALRKLPLNNLPHHEPSGVFLEILQNYQEHLDELEESPLNFYLRMAANKDSDGKEQGTRFRGHISDVLIYKDDIFTIETSRGRKGVPNINLKTNQIGLMKFEHSAHFKGLVNLPGQSWYADCKTQKADYSSIHYTSALNTDCPYITGPSGMTSLFMNMFFLLTNPKDPESILSYSLGVMTYIVGAGYHSIKEVLIPMVKCLDLLPNYTIQDGFDFIKGAPLYNLYFEALMEFDEEFTEIHREIWKNHLAYFTNIYMPLAMRKHCQGTQLSEQSTTSHEATEMISIVSNSINSCLTNYTTQIGYGFFAGSVDQQTIALSILKDVCQQQNTVTSIFRHIQAYCVGSFYNENNMNVSKKMQQSFLGFLLNSLKEKPTFLSYLNLAMNFEKTVSVDPKMDACSPEFEEQRNIIHLTIKHATINDMENVDNTNDSSTDIGSDVMFAGWK
ncbi:MAG: protein kinase family protein [Tatlockia sp.]|nr:protein kinase family protein [Tatlockia sp.]